MSRTKYVLAIKHIAIEGPGTIEDFFMNTTWDLRTIDLSLGSSLPEDLENIAAIISLGGPMNVYEEDKYGFLRREGEFLKKAVSKEIPILGICLGAQLLAKACGSKVKKAAQREIGWYEADLTEAAKEDALLAGLPRRLNVFQWHEDTFEIPEGGMRLAGSESCQNQAFRFGRNAYGLQFHVEVTPEMIKSWIGRYKKTGLSKSDSDKMLIEAYKTREALVRQNGLIYLNFARLIKASEKSGVT